jgi:hypothetical protein
MREKVLFDREWYFHCGDVNIDYPQIKGPVYTMAKTERMRMGPASRYYDIDVDGYSYKGEIKSESSTNEIVKLYAMCERALMYDWCICGGEYSLSHYAKSVLPLLFNDMMK